LACEKALTDLKTFSSWFEIDILSKVMWVTSIYTIHHMYCFKLSCLDTPAALCSLTGQVRMCDVFVDAYGPSIYHAIAYETRRSHCKIISYVDSIVLCFRTVIHWTKTHIKSRSLQSCDALMSCSSEVPPMPPVP
jgi:hypothetical protein